MRIVIITIGTTTTSYESALFLVLLVLGPLFAISDWPAATAQRNLDSGQHSASVIYPSFGNQAIDAAILSTTCSPSSACEGMVLSEARKMHSRFLSVLHGAVQYLFRSVRQLL